MPEEYEVYSIVVVPNRPDMVTARGNKDELGDFSLPSKGGKVQCDGQEVDDAGFFKWYLTSGRCQVKLHPDQHRYGLSTRTEFSKLQ